MLILFRLLSHKRISYSFRVKLFSTSNWNKNSVKGISDPNFKIVFLGNDNFSLHSLKIIAEIVPSKDCVSVVVSNTNNIIGKYAKSESLRSVLWDDFKSKENQDNFDIGVVASFGYLIPKIIIEKCHMGILNVHGSLLPKLRGAAPVSRAIINGDTETGISIMKIAPHKFDIGPILLREKCRIDPHIRAPELTTLLAVIGGQSLKKVLLNIDNYIDKLDSQVEEAATLAPKLSSDMAQINWKQNSSSQIYNLFRGLCGTFKTFTFYQGRKIDLDDIGLVFEGDCETSNSSQEKNCLHEDTDFSSFYPNPVTIFKESKHRMWTNSYIPGQFFVEKNLLFVKCGNNDWIFIRRVKVGAKWMSAKDFQNGFVSKVKSQQLFDFSADLIADNVKRHIQSK